MDLPVDFILRTEKLLGEDSDNLIRAIKQEPSVSLRINNKKYNTENITLENISWCHSGYYLPKRPSFTFDPLFHAGCYYPQEASSMFIEQALKQYATDSIRVLDLCAAPGGKSTHILSLLSENSLLVTNEVIRTRANILSENITKWGYPNVLVTNNDPADFGKIKNYFDAILVDAPCSGEGMFRKDSGAISEWSPANVQLCCDRQRRILADVWDSLKPGGILIYSTCTYNSEEDEDNVSWVCETLGAEPLGIKTQPEWNITGALKGNLSVYRFLPHKTKGEGFFLSVMRKNSEAENIILPNNKNKGKKSKATNKELLAYLNEPDNFSIIQIKEKWYAIPTLFYDDYSFLESRLKIINSGICLGEIKGKDFIPDQSLALSASSNKDLFPNHEVSWREAISYLRKEPLTFSSNTPKGYILLTYQGIPLGFVKNIGNRANNLYPHEWRIRTSDIPNEPTEVVK